MQRRQEYSNILQEWVGKATLEELKKLAAAVRTSVEVVRQTANAYRTGGAVRVIPTYAKALEKATDVLHRRGLPKIKREQLCQACNECDFAKRCRKEDTQKAAADKQQANRKFLD